MRRSFQLVSLAVSLVFVAQTALAQKKPKDKKHEKSDGPSAAATWTDPAESEKSDKGPYTPKADGDEKPAPEPKRTRSPDKGRKRDKLQAFGQIIIGFGQAPQNKADYEPGYKGTAIGFQVGGRYDFTPAFSLGLRIPLTTASIKEPPRTQNSTSFGSPQIFAEYRLSLSRLSSVPIFFGVGIPVAAGDYGYHDQPNTTQFTGAYVNQLADATSGWRDSELFTPKHLPFVIGAGFHHDREDFELHADAKFVLLPALSTSVLNSRQEGANAGDFKINSFALREVTTLGGTYNILQNPLLYAGLDLSVIWTPIQVFQFDSDTTSDKPTTVQAVLEPRVGARFGHVSPSIGYIAPLGGRLGNAGDGGIRLRVEALF